ncbi:MAG TPA: helix-hairpin-helix domain-containing protein [Kribbella sp.]|nr:helix-hairpin-helix domain-containing protein [Kribbella sp.]
MRLRTRYSGRAAPFERRRRLVLRRLPAGAVISRALLTVTPYSADPGRRFLETITFPGPVGDWGANKVRPGDAVEIDLHTRRKLASLTGAGLKSGTLLVDLGGGYLGVNSAGGLGDGPPLSLADSMDLPGLTVTGLRVANAGADISALRVVSPPSNLTLAVEGGPVFFTRTGDLVEPVTTPDFGSLLQGMLLDLPIENGCYAVPFELSSDSISRLDLDLDIEYTVAVSGTPEGLPTIQTSYRYDGAPTAAPGLLSVAVPPGLVAVPGGTAGRVQGGFEPSKVVFGALTPTATEQIAVSASGPLAQPFELPATEVASSIDLLLAAVTAEAKLSVDVVNDLDGKPGRASLLVKSAELTLSRDEAGSPTWLNVPLPAELELPGGVRHWLLVQALEGTATWGAGPAPQSLQRTTDGGLSWRAVAGIGAQLRLRHATSTFRIPLELRVAAGNEEVAVSLQRFAAQGAVDLELDFPEVAGAVNTVVAAAGTAQVSAEHVANGDFTEWYRVGTVVSGPVPLGDSAGRQSLGRAVAFAPDGATVFVGAQGVGTRLHAYDVFTRQVRFDTELGSGYPVAMALDPSAELAVIALHDFSAASGEQASSLLLATTSSGRPIGSPMAVPEPVLDVVRVADGSGVLLLGREDSDGTRAVVRYVPWPELRSGAPDWKSLPSDRSTGWARALAAGSDGAIYLLVEGDGGSSLVRYSDRFALSAGNSTSVSLPAGAVDLAIVPGRSQVLVVGAATAQFLTADDLSPVAPVITFPEGSTPQCLAVDPSGELGVVIQDGAVLTIDLKRRALLPPSGAELSGTSDGAEIAISPAGTHAVVTLNGGTAAQLLTLGEAQPADWELTAGKVRPFALRSTGEVLALLGDPGSRKLRVPQPAAISQPVAVAANTRYRFAFDGISEDEEAVGQLIWRGAGCSPGRTDRVVVTTFDPDRETALERVPRHELVVTSPAGATQAEIRFFTPGGLTAVDHVSLAGTAEAVSALPSAWESSAPTTVVSPTDTGFTLTNGGSTDAVVSQLVPIGVDALQRFELRLTARVSDRPASVELAFADEAEAPLGAPVTMVLDPLDFEDRAMAGPVPAGAAVADLRFVVPVGGSVELAAVSLVCGAAQEVGLQFVSEAPGELALTGVIVQLDEGEPAVAPLPADGLCPSTPVGEGLDGEQCFCGTCGVNRPVRRQVPVVTPAGRPALVADCPVCRTQRVRLGGRPAARSTAVPLPRFRVTDRPLGVAGPAIMSRVEGELPLVAVRGIATARAAELTALGIGDLVALAAADVRTVASLDGISDKMARRLIDEASELVRTHGVRVIFPT